MSEQWQATAIALSERHRCIDVIDQRITYWEERGGIKAPYMAAELREVKHRILTQPTTNQLEEL